MVSGEAAVVINSPLPVPSHDPPEENIDRQKATRGLSEILDHIVLAPNRLRRAPGSDQVITNEDSAEGNSATFPSWCANPPIGLSSCKFYFTIFVVR